MGWTLMMWISLIYAQSISVVCVCARVCVCECEGECHGSVTAFMCWKSSKRDWYQLWCAHTHTLTAISHYTTLAVKLNVCAWLNAKALTERSKRVKYSERQHCSSLLISNPPLLICSFLVFIIHTSPSSIHQNMPSFIITVIPIYQIIYALRIVLFTASFSLFCLTQAYFS